LLIESKSKVRLKKVGKAFLLGSKLFYHEATNIHPQTKWLYTLDVWEKAD